jgi:hypothetical protein
VRRVAGRTALVVALLSIAALLLLVGVVLRMGGLDLAADVAQLVSVLLAVPGAAVPLIDKFRAPASAIESGEVVRASAEIRNGHYVATEDATGRHVTVPASGHTLRVTVETAEAAAIILRGLRVVIVSRGPASGEFRPHRGALEPRPFEVVLDDDPPMIIPAGGGKDFPFTVSATDPEMFEITVRVDSGDVRWRLELDWSLRERQGTVQIDAAGAPFRTMSVPTNAPDPLGGRG